MNREIEVYWWGSDGAVYVVREHRSGFRNRHRRLIETHHGEIRGREYRKPGFELADASTILLNRGFEYKLHVLVDGERQVLLVDALHDYHVFDVPDGVELHDVEPVEKEAPRASSGDAENPGGEAASRDRSSAPRTPRTRRKSGSRKRGGKARQRSEGEGTS